MDSSPKSLHLGGISWNTMVYIDQFPEPRPQTVFAGRSHSTVGSSGAGKALNLASLGTAATLWGLLGDDEPGRLARDFLTRRGIELITEVDPGGTPQHINLMDGAGDRISIFANIGSQDYVVDAERLRNRAAEADIVSLNISNYCRQFIPMLHDLGREVWVDIHDYDGSNPYHDDFIGVADFLLMSSLALPDWRSFLESRVAAGTKAAICTHGAQGASGLVAGQGWVDIQSVPVAEVVDTNGAGDAFFAGFSLGWLEGLGLASSLDRGAQVAAAAVQSPDLAL